MRILVGDDRPVTGDLLGARFSEAPDLTVIGIAGDTNGTVKAIRDLAPEDVLADVRMPVLDGSRLRTGCRRSVRGW